MARITLVNVLRVVWVVAILWYELAVFSYEVSKCPWPQVSVREMLVALLRLSLTRTDIL